jgi:murein DD-endopeptidase MepM/ murein hydrolase activator NlpD
LAPLKLSPRLRDRLLRVAVLAALPLTGVIAAISSVPDQPPPQGSALVETLAFDAERALVPDAAGYIREERYQRADTPSGLVSRLGLADEEARRLMRSYPGLMRALRPGLTVTAEVDAEGRLLWLSHLGARDALVTVIREGEGFRASEDRASLETRVLLRSGVIRSSLFAATDAANIPDSVAMQLADIFGGDIDFHRDLRRNDRFSVVYEMSYLQGRAVRAGRVLAAEFVNGGKSFRALNHAGAYYAPDGKNLRKAFLRSPLEFSRISSGFATRMHPILREWRAHRGVDYAAPTGTQVRATGDAVVEFAGRQAGYGNVVILRHHGQYRTLYAHLNGFSKAIRKGARVAQGETIGSVGQTGWATGPHLHYEFLVDGVQRNPLTIALPAAQPVVQNDMDAFRRYAAGLVAQLDLLAIGNLAALE